MDRLTKSSDSGMVWYKSDLLLLEPCELSYGQVREVLRRLAAYEDTGLTPEQIEQVKARLPLHNWTEETPDKISIFGVQVSRLKELAQADKEGRVLQYAPGDTVHDRFGMAWTVTAAEIHQFADGPLRYLYRCGHPGTNDYRSLYSDEISQNTEVRP